MTLVETSLCEDDDEDCIPSSQTQHSFSLARSPFADPKLLRVKIPDSPEEKLAQVSTVQVDNDMAAENSVEDDKENKLCNSSDVDAEGIAAAVTTPAACVTRRRRGAAAWLSTDSKNSPKSPRHSLSASKEKNKSEKAVKQSEPKNTTTKRKRKSQSSKFSRKKSRSLSSKDELNDIADQSVEQDIVTANEDVMVEKDSNLDCEDTKPFKRCNVEIHEKDISSYFTKCKNSSSDKKPEQSPEKTDTCTNLVIDGEIAREGNVEVPCSTSNDEFDQKTLHSRSESSTSTSIDQHVEEHNSESSSCSLAVKTEGLENIKNDDGDERKSKITCTSSVTVSQHTTVVTSHASVCQTSSCSSPVSKTRTTVSSLQCSPKALACLPSPLASPASILKKRSFCQSPSPPLKNRRVSFQLPEGAAPLKEDSSGAAQERDKFQGSGRMMKPKSKKKDACIYPDLVQCTTSIDQILPSITFSRGIGQVVRAQNILTIGDLSSLTETQVENLPIRSPKVRTVKNALMSYSSRQKSSLKSPVSMTPQKDAGGGIEAVLGTPSKHGDLIKPTSLFSVFGKSVKEELRSPLPVKLKEEPESPLIVATVRPECPNPQSIAEEDVSDWREEVSTSGNSATINDENPPQLQSKLLEEIEEILNDSLLSGKKSDSGIRTVATALSESTVDVEVVEEKTVLGVPSNKDFIKMECQDIPATDITEGIASADGIEEDVIYLTPTNENQTEIEEEIPRKETANNKKSGIEQMNCTDEIKAILEEVTEKGNEILSNISRLREEEESGHKVPKPVEETAQEVDDSFESAFAAGDISPIKNNNESSFFEMSSTDVGDKDEEDQHKLQKEDDDVSNVSADIPAMEGITPLANESDLNETSLNVGGVELQTSVVCVPSSMISTSTIAFDESTLKEARTSSEEPAQDVDVTVLDICSNIDQGTFSANPVSNDLNINTPHMGPNNIHSTHKGILPPIDIANLPTHDIFEFVGELENLKTAIMAELRTRMLGGHGKND